MSTGSVRKASMYEMSSTRATSSNTIIVEMKQGDLASVQLEASNGGYIYSDSRYICSTFSGFLLFKS